MSDYGECPFAQRLKGERIYCEIARITPPDGQAKKDLVRSYCAHKEGYKDCTLYKVLMQYYDRIYGKEGNQ